jgi:hypothetical protein
VPAPETILTGLSTIANDWRWLAVTWHFLLAALLVLVAAGWRPAAWSARRRDLDLPNRDPRDRDRPHRSSPISPLLGVRLGRAFALIRRPSLQPLKREAERRARTAGLTGA